MAPDQCERRRIDAGTAKAVAVAGLEEDVLLKVDVGVREDVVPVAFSVGHLPASAGATSLESPDSC